MERYVVAFWCIGIVALFVGAIRFLNTRMVTIDQVAMSSVAFICCILVIVGYGAPFLTPFNVGFVVSLFGALVLNIYRYRKHRAR